MAETFDYGTPSTVGTTQPAGLDFANKMTFGSTLSELLRNPNVQTLMANVGMGLDPRGAGGYLGAAAQALIKGKAAQMALAKQEASTNPEAMVKALGMTPQGQQGFSSITYKKDGSIVTTYDPQPAPVSTAPTTGGAAPSAQTLQNVPTAPVNQPLGALPQTSSAVSPNTPGYASRLSDLYPFFSAPESLPQMTYGA